MKKKQQKGFGKVRFLILGAFFVVLFVISSNFFDFNGVAAFLRDNQRKQDLQYVQKGLLEYYKVTGRYPSSSEKFTIVGLNDKQIQWGQSWTPFLNHLPTDPDNKRQYVYYASQNGRQAYFLYASLERDTSINSCHGKCPHVPQGASCGEVCNYGITSNNVSP